MLNTYPLILFLQVEWWSTLFPSPVQLLKAPSHGAKGYLCVIVKNLSKLKYLQKIVSKSLKIVFESQPSFLKT